MNKPHNGHVLAKLQQDFDRADSYHKYISLTPEAGGPKRKPPLTEREFAWIILRSAIDRLDCERNAWLGMSYHKCKCSQWLGGGCDEQARI